MAKIWSQGEDNTRSKIVHSHWIERLISVTVKNGKEENIFTYIKKIVTVIINERVES